MTDCGVSIQHHEETQGPSSARKECVPGQGGGIGYWERGELRGRIWPPLTSAWLALGSGQGGDGGTVTKPVPHLRLLSLHILKTAPSLGPSLWPRCLMDMAGCQRSLLGEKHMSHGRPTAPPLTHGAGQILYHRMPRSLNVLHLPSILPMWRHPFCTSDHSKVKRVLHRAVQCHLFIKPVKPLRWGKVELGVPLGLLTSLCIEEKKRV